MFEGLSFQKYLVLLILVHHVQDQILFRIRYCSGSDTVQSHKILLNYLKPESGHNFSLFFPTVLTGQIIQSLFVQKPKTGF